MDHPSPIVEKHPRLYLPDGNFVLSANQDVRIILFRVHKSICALHSEIFEGMLAHDTYIAETYEEAPVVEMPDTAEQIEAMLEAMYGLSEWKFASQEPDFPTLVENLMAMVTKYEIKPIRQDIIEVTNLIWPATLEKWDKFQESLNPHENSWETISDPAAAAVFARRFDLPELRAVALHSLSCLDARAQWQGQGGDRNWCNGRRVRWDLLSRDDFRDLSCVQEYKRDLRLKEVVEHEDYRCHAQPSCGQSHKNDDLFEADKLTSVLWRSNDILTSLGLYQIELENRYEGSGLCEFHWKAAKFVARNRESYWESLLRIARGEMEPLRTFL
ncbi:hypothetical protein DFH11DRAFT_1508402 [Phellopilus nigrolimitatus]|nr:hypothetical protein DFH11DRAFT_1508402 [Phellopilus nigrolimitatus]